MKKGDPTLNEDIVWSKGEVAKKLGCSSKTVERLIQRPKNPLPAFKMGRLVRIHPDDYRAWLADERRRNSTLPQWNSF